MPERSYEDPLTPEEREEFEEDLVSVCEDQLDLLGDIEGLDVLYAGGHSLLWVEGLSRRIGEGGSLTALDLNEEGIENTRGQLSEADLRSPVNLVTGDVLESPFENETFDLVYSAGFFHELEVSEEPAEEAFNSLKRVVRPGGRIATADFVDSVPAVQIEEERFGSELRDELFGRGLYGIGPVERLVALHEGCLKDVSRRVLTPAPARHFEKIVLAEEEPGLLSLLPDERIEFWIRRWAALRERARVEGYTRPAMVYLEGRVPGA